MLFAKAGYAIAISNSRGQEFLTPLVNLIDANVKTTTVADAIKFGDVILLVLPWRKRQELFTSKIVIDATNPYSESFAVLDRGNDTSTETIAKQISSYSCRMQYTSVYNPNRR
jgi:8-hydroxy-5-deazaflavin:NADPH oxidoreductase